MTELDRLKEDLENESDEKERTELVDGFWGHVLESGTPVVVDDTTILFLYRGPEDRVRVSGDMTNWSDVIEMERVAETELFEGRATVPSDARIEYVVLLDDDPPEPDPWCEFVVLNGLGAHSEVAMPDYEYHPALIPTRGGAVGPYNRVRKHVIPAGIMGYEKEIFVYTPPGYESSDKAYPTVYIQDGRDYIEYAHTPHVLDELTGERQIEPVLAVFIAPPNRHVPDSPNRVTEYGLNPDYPKWMADELVPFVEARYRARRDPAERMVVGDSFAGLVSAYIPFEKPDVFGIGYSQSGYVSLNNDALIERYAESEKKPIRLYVDVGIFEETVGKDWLPEDEINFTEANRRFQSVLEEKGYDFVYREYPEGHTWGNWRRHLIDALEHFFPREHE